MLKRAALLVLISATAFSCGYKVASQNRLDQGFRSILVRPLENRTTQIEVDQILTRALSREVVQSTSLQVVNSEGQADVILTGVITSLRASPITIGRTAFGSTFLVTLHLRVELNERETGRVVFSRNDYIFREQYVINVDVENFFSELNPALDRIARDFASSVVTTIRESF
jgi:hypothetical protein